MSEPLEPTAYDDDEPMPDVSWDIRREGYLWSKELVRSRYDLSPEKIELLEGKIFWCDAERLTMIALLLENVGVDKVVRLGDPNVWREAVAALDPPGEAKDNQ